MKKLKKRIFPIIMIMAILLNGFSFGLADPYKPVLGVVADEELQIVKAGEKIRI